MNLGFFCDDDMKHNDLKELQIKLVKLGASAEEKWRELMAYLFDQLYRIGKIQYYSEPSFTSKHNNANGIDTKSYIKILGNLSQYVCFLDGIHTNWEFSVDRKKKLKKGMEVLQKKIEKSGESIKDQAFIYCTFLILDSSKKQQYKNDIINFGWYTGEVIDLNYLVRLFEQEGHASKLYSLQLQLGLCDTQKISYYLENA